MKELITLFMAFFKIGICTFGGGYAMLPMLEREIVRHYNWTTTDELLDYFAIGQCTPGIIAINTATFIGYKRKGVWGGIFATSGVVMPSFIIITIIAALLSEYMDNEFVLHAFAGIRIAVCALIIGTVVKLVKSSCAEYWQIILAVLAFMIVVFLRINTVYVILAVFAGNILRYLLKNRKKEDKQ